jgi:hypothetical protein
MKRLFLSLLTLVSIAIVGCAEDAPALKTAPVAVAATAGGEKGILDPWKAKATIADGPAKFVDGKLSLNLAFLGNLEPYMHVEVRGDGLCLPPHTDKSELDISWSHGPTVEDKDGDGWIAVDTTWSCPGTYDISLVGTGVRTQPGLSATDVVEVWPAYAKHHAQIKADTRPYLHIVRSDMDAHVAVTTVRIEIFPGATPTTPGPVLAAAGRMNTAEMIVARAKAEEAQRLAAIAKAKAEEERKKLSEAEAAKLAAETDMTFALEETEQVAFTADNTDCTKYTSADGIEVIDCPVTVPAKRVVAKGKRYKAKATKAKKKHRPKRASAKKR